MSQATTTPTQQLVDMQLGGQLEDFVRSSRTAGRPWRRIERDLWEQHGIEVTYETLRRWFPDEPVIALEAAPT